MWDMKNVWNSGLEERSILETVINVIEQYFLYMTKSMIEKYTVNTVIKKKYLHNNIYLYTIVRLWIPILYLMSHFNEN